MSMKVGFDVSMGKSTLAIYNQDQECVLESEFEHSQTGFKWLKSVLDDFLSVECILESTGVYSRQLSRFLKENEFVHYELNPYEAKIKLNATLRVHKTDKVDAHKLALLLFKEKFEKYKTCDSIYDQLRCLSRFYEELEAEISQVRNELHATLQLCFPGIEKMFSKTDSPFYLRIVQAFPHPNKILDCSRTILKNRIRCCTEKNISANRLLNYAENLISLANECYPAVEDSHFACDQVVYYAKNFLLLLAEKESCTKKMVDLAAQLPEFNVLLSIPGIGENTAVRFIAEAGDLQRFKSHKQLNAFTGIDVRRIQSGTLQIKDRINKRGNPHLRKLLYVMIMNMLRNQRRLQSHIVDYYYYKQKDHYGKFHKVAVVACMNKLLKTITYLTQNNATYDYSLATHRM